jgi:hypothetical protein
MQDNEWENLQGIAEWQQNKPAPWEKRAHNLGKLLKDRLHIGTDLITNEPLLIEPKQLSTHLHVLGASGVGKSFFLEGLIKTLIIQGHGLCLIDPHGDLYHRVLDFCTWLHIKHPKQGIAKRVIPFDVAESKQMLGFNPMARNARVMTYQVVALMEAIRKAWGQNSFNDTPRLARWLFNTAYAVIEAELTLIQSKHLLDPKPNLQRDAIIQRVKHPDIRGEWEYIAGLRDKERNEFVESSYNRMFQFVQNEVISRILGRRERALDFPSVLSGQKILLVNLARQNTISEDNQRMLGTLLVNELLTAAFARPREERTPFFLFIDEFSRFVTKDICEILDGGRKFGLHLVLAHQHLNQLKQNDPEVYYSTLTNARLKSVFGGLGEEDLDLLGRELYTGEQDPMKIKQEIWRTMYEPVETTRVVEAESESRAEGRSHGHLTHESLGSSELMIPGSGGLAGPEVTSMTMMHGSAFGDSDVSSGADSSGRSRSLVPWYEYHKKEELSSREFWNLEEQLYLKKAQLKRQPNQHHAFLMPDSNVQMLKTGNLVDHGKLITDSQRGELKAEAFEHAGCFDTAENVRREQAQLEDRLLAPETIEVSVIESSAEADSIKTEAEKAMQQQPRRTRPQKPKSNSTKSNPYDSVTPLFPDNQTED